MKNIISIKYKDEYMKSMQETGFRSKRANIYNVLEDSPTVVILKNKISDSIFQKKSIINVKFLSNNNE